MVFQLIFTDEARSQLRDLETDERKLKKVQNCLARIQLDPKHPGLNSHKYTAIKGKDGQDIWESYVENNTPSAWRIFWFYGEETGQIS